MGVGRKKQTETESERMEKIETGKTMTDRQQADRHLYKCTDRVTDKQIQTKYKQTKTDKDNPTQTYRQGDGQKDGQRKTKG